MVKAAVALLRKIRLQICGQIFRQNSTPSLPVTARPQGQFSGAVPGAFASPPELHLNNPAPGLAQTPELDPASEDLISQVLDQLSLTFESRDLATGVIRRLRDLIGDLPASADHHHSEPHGLLRHSLEVALKMLEEFERTVVAKGEPGPSADTLSLPPDSPQWQYLWFLAGLGHDLGKLLEVDVRAGDWRWSPLHDT
jgi:hypothetical protein